MLNGTGRTVSVQNISQRISRELARFHNGEEINRKRGHAPITRHLPPNIDEDCMRYLLYTELIIGNDEISIPKQFQ